MVSVIFWDLFFFLGMSAPDSVSNEQTQNMGCIGNVLVGDFGAPCALRETGRLVGLDYGLKLRTCFGMLSVFSWKIYVRISRKRNNPNIPKRMQNFYVAISWTRKKKEITVHVCVDFLLFIESSKVYFLHFTVHQIAGKGKRICVRTKDKRSKRQRTLVNMPRKRCRKHISRL